MNNTKQFVHSNSNLKGELYDFEKFVAYVVPICSITLIIIEDETSMVSVYSINITKKNCSTRIELHYYKSLEILKLPNAQKNE